MSWSLPSFAGRELELELLDPNAVSLYRLFRHPGMDWDAPPEQFRNERVDPPVGEKGRFAVLYLADTVKCIAMECRVLRADVMTGRFSWDPQLATAYRLAGYRFERPAIFVPLDGPNCSEFGLDDAELPLGDNAPFQALSLTLFQRFGDVVHGLSWRSMHRGQPGRVYALWHHHKATIELATVPPDRAYLPLIESTEWAEVLQANPLVERLDSAPR